MRPDRIFVTGRGRLRLGWRLGLFGTLLMVLVLLQALVLDGGGAVVRSVETLAAALAAGWTMLALERRPPSALGFHPGGSALREVGWGFGLGVGVAGMVLAGIALVGAVRWSGEPGSLGGWLATGGASLAFFVVPAAAEEAVFRGYPLQALAESWGPGAALIVTSVGFGLVHLQNPGADWIGTLNVAGAGLLLGAVYLRTASLWWATAVHVGWNWTHGFLADLPVSGLEVVDAPWVVSRVAGPAWLSGGAFGPEASVVTTLVVLLAALWVWRTPRLAPSAAALEARPLFEPPVRGRGRAGRDDPKQRG